MAVYQISRIQIRRGQANQGTGLPQLASGEMAWAIDTQELYIGNGSVGEGAPAVGNTKILTTNDLSSQAGLINSIFYTYKVDDSTIQTSTISGQVVQRSIQKRLDDNVNTNDFGVVITSNIQPDVDATNSLQHTINELYRNSTKASDVDNYGQSTHDAVARRVVLTIPPGIYNTNRTLYIPSYTTIVGAGSDKTIIKYNPTVTFTGLTTQDNYPIITFFDVTNVTTNLAGSSAIGNAYIPGGNAVATSISLANSYISGITLHVGALDLGTIEPGQILFGPGIFPNTYIVQNIDGLGSGSTWQIACPTHTYNTPTASGTIIGTGIILSSTFTGSIVAGISNGLLTVSATISGSVVAGQLLSGTGVPANTYILASITSNTFLVSTNQAVASTVITGTGAISLTNTGTSPIGAGTGISLELALTGAAIQTVTDISTFGFNTTNNDPAAQGALNQEGVPTSSNHARHIHLKGLTIQVTTGDNTALELNSTSDSLFEDIKLIGGPSYPVFNTVSTGIALNSKNAVLTQNNIFRDVILNNFTFGVYSSGASNSNVFENPYVDGVYMGFVLGYNYTSQFNHTSDQLTVGSDNKNQIINGNFNNVRRQAVLIGTGTGNTVANTKLYNVGNNGGANSLYPQIYCFTNNNSVTNVYSDRTAASFDSTNLTSFPYIPEVGGNVTYKTIGFEQISGLVCTTSPSNIGPQFVFRLPVCTDELGETIGNAVYNIDYTYNSTVGSYVRKGTITISATFSPGSPFSVNHPIQLSDGYNFAGSDGTLGDGSQTSVALDFSAQYLDASGSSYSDSSVGLPTSIGIFYTNKLPNERGQLSYSYTASFSQPN